MRSSAYATRARAHALSVVDRGIQRCFGRGNGHDFLLVRGASRPGLTIGINGLAGNLGVALAALTTGLLVKYFGWRTAFAVPALVAIGAGIAFARVASEEPLPPAKRTATQAALPVALAARVFAVLTIASVTASLLFNFTTNGNGELLRERLADAVSDPAWLGALLALVYVAGSFAQVAVGALIDRVPLKRLYVAVAFGVSSLAVWALGPIVKAAGFDALLYTMTAIAVGTLIALAFLPAQTHAPPVATDARASPTPQSTPAAD